MLICASVCVCGCVWACMCVCVCVTMKKSAWRMASTTSDTGDTSSKQQQAQRKQKYNKSSRSVSSVDHCRRVSACVCVCVCVRACMHFFFVRSGGEMHVWMGVPMHATLALCYCCLWWPALIRQFTSRAEVALWVAVAVSKIDWVNWTLTRSSSAIRSLFSLERASTWSVSWQRNTLFFWDFVGLEPSGT